VPPLLPADKDYPSPPPSPWPTWVKLLNVVTLARLLAKMASLATSSEHA
jgi:hypothetical protein